MGPEHRIELRLETLRRAGLYRDPERAEEDAGTGGVASSVVDVRSNDYLGLAAGHVAVPSGEPLGDVVSRETTESIRVGAGAARLIAGTHVAHLKLERGLAAWLGTEACLLFSSAYAANVGAVSALAVEGDVVFSDVLNHASIIDGCRLSRAQVVVLPHRDLGALAGALEGHRGSGTRWVVTEAYFGMDATSPDFGALRALCDRAGAALVVDEAHSLGVFGAEGRGVAARAGVRPDVLVGGFGKAFGLQGGFVASSLGVRRWLWNSARSFVFSTAPSPWLCEQGLRHLLWLRQAESARRHLEGLGRRLESALQEAGVSVPGGRHGPIFPILLGHEAAALDAAVRLRSLGVVGQAIRPPTVPRGTARLRVTLRADMTEEQVDAVAAALTTVWRERVPRAAPLQSADRSTPAAAAPVLAERLPKDERGPQAALSRPCRWVVLGTGTGVGKTFVAEALVRALGAEGRPVAGLKPVETGCEPTLDGYPRSGDAARLESASFHVKHPRPHPLYAFRPPLAPSLAARQAGQTLRLEEVVAWVNRVSSSTSATPTLVVESAGATFSPLTETWTNFDLALQLGPASWVLVAPDRLGVLHEVTSTLRAMESLKRLPDYLLLNAPEQPDESTGTNAEELRRMGLDIPVLVLGRQDTATVSALLRMVVAPLDPQRRA